MFPPLLYLVLLFGLLLCFPLGIFPLPVLALKERLYLREQDTGKGLYLVIGNPCAVVIGLLSARHGITPLKLPLVEQVALKHRTVSGDETAPCILGYLIGGFHGDCAATYPCGKISEEAQRLIDVTRQSFFEGFAQAREGNRISDISHAVQAYVEANGFSVVREYVGHGVGRNMHEAPEIPNYGAPGHGPKLLRGMTIAVEPMVNAGTAAIRQMSDGWTVKTRDGKYAAHYENTILITAGEPEILTAPAP